MTVKPAILFFLFIGIVLFTPINTSFGEGRPQQSTITTQYSDIILTEGEKEWLKNHPIIRARVGNNPPFHFHEGGNFGISVDYFDLIADMVGFEVEYVPGIPWHEALEGIKKKEQIDVVLTAKKTRARQHDMLFSYDYLIMPWVIFSRTDSDFISSINDLAGKTVSVEKGFVMHNLLKANFPTINLLVKTHSKEAVEAVATGTADAYIGNLATSTYIINKHNFVNLKVASPAPFGNHNQAFVVRQDWPEFVSILNKAIAVIPATKISELRNKWFNLKFEYGITKSKFFTWIGAIIAISLIFLLFFLGWVVVLRKQIARRQQAEKEKSALEHRLQQAQKMEAIGTLAGGIAHDFNNILGVIIGYSELAKEDTRSPQLLEEDLGEILKAANRAKELVKQILAFSRQTEIEPLQLKLQPLIAESLAMLRPTIPTTITIHENVDSECGAVVADPTQVHQILLNLCANAYQAMESTGGTLTISLKSIQIASDNSQNHTDLNPGQYVRLTVADTGVGIDKDIIDRIFDPYFSTKEVGKGTGLGLSIIHGIMKQYGGEISVDSQLGLGTRFNVHFPLASDEPLPSTQEVEHFPMGTERVLLVDDEIILADMGKTMLERLGYRVTVCYKSKEAVEIFQNNPDIYDLVVTDQTMPEMTGTDLVQEIRKIRPSLPVILCTGYSDLIEQELLTNLGINGFALKPLTKNTIAKLIREALASDA